MRNISQLVDQATRDLRPRHRQGIKEQKSKSSPSSYLELKADLEKLEADQTLEEDAPHNKYMNEQNKNKSQSEDKASEETSRSCTTATLISVVVVAILVAVIFCVRCGESPASIPNTSNDDVQHNLKELEKDFPR
jgi:preprotein translocase subunit SecF